MLDISVTYARKTGEKRKSCIGRKHHEWKTSNYWNPYPEMINHRKHESLIYREANGDFRPYINRRPFE